MSAIGTIGRTGFRAAVRMPWPRQICVERVDDAISSLQSAFFAAEVAGSHVQVRDMLRESIDELQGIRSVLSEQRWRPA